MYLVLWAFTSSPVSLVATTRAFPFSFTVCMSCQRSRKKSNACLSLQLSTPRMTVKVFLHKRLRLHNYKIKILHEITDTDEYTRTENSNFMLNDNFFYGE